MSNPWPARIVCWVILFAMAWAFGYIASRLLEGQWEFAAHIAIAFYTGAGFVRIYDYHERVRCLIRN